MTSVEIQLERTDLVSSAEFIKKILDHAKSLGIDQATLAEKTGISPESLSRLKREGRCRLSTALSLAISAGLTQLNLSDTSKHKSASTVAAGKLSSGRRTRIESETLIRCLSGKECSASYRPHLFGFFEELPIDLIHDVILDEDLDYVILSTIAKTIGAEGENVAWLNEMANYSMA